MPTYVYECSACQTTFEADQSIKDDPLDTCECGSKGTVKRIIQPVGIAFKGSGFHINDYKGSSGASPAVAPSGSESTSEASSSSPTPTESTSSTSSSETKSA